MRDLWRWKHECHVSFEELRRCWDRLKLGNLLFWRSRSHTTSTSPSRFTRWQCYQGISFQVFPKDPTWSFSHVNRIHQQEPHLIQGCSRYIVPALNQMLPSSIHLYTWGSNHLEINRTLLQSTSNRLVSVWSHVLAAIIVVISATTPLIIVDMIVIATVRIFVWLDWSVELLNCHLVKIFVWILVIITDRLSCFSGSLICLGGVYFGGTFPLMEKVHRYRLHADFWGFEGQWHF